MYRGFCSILLFDCTHPLAGSPSSLRTIHHLVCEGATKRGKEKMHLGKQGGMSVSPLPTLLITLVGRGNAVVGGHTSGAEERTKTQATISPPPFLNQQQSFPSVQRKGMCCTLDPYRSMTMKKTNVLDREWCWLKCLSASDRSGFSSVGQQSELEAWAGKPAKTSTEPHHL